jgi:hypothetical protein
MLTDSNSMLREDIHTGPAAAVQTSQTLAIHRKRLSIIAVSLLSASTMRRIGFMATPTFAASRGNARNAQKSYQEECVS